MSKLTRRLRNGRSQRPLSRPLRRARLRRLVIGLIFGFGAGFCLSQLIAQFGFASFYHGSPPWWAGIAAGLLASVFLAIGRSVVRQLRIQLAVTKSALLGIGLLAATLGAGMITPNRAAAQTTGTCAVSVSIDGGPLTEITGNTRSSALEVDPNNPGSFQFQWSIPESVATADSQDGPLTMFLRIRTLGLPNELHRQTAQDDSGTFVAVPTNLGVPPGIYPVWGELKRGDEVICREQQAWVRIVGSPLGFPHGPLTAGGLAASLIGLGMVYRSARFDRWSFTTSERMTVEIIDSQTGRPVRGPLLRGQAYTARTTIEFPDPTSSYVGVPGPIEVTVGVLGSTSAALVTSSLIPAKGAVTTDTPFTVPQAGQTLELVNDVSVAGNVIESVRIAEAIDGSATRLDIGGAIGQVIYKVGDFSAAQLQSLRPVDTTIMLHGSGDKSALEAWIYEADVTGGPVRSRTVIEVDRFDELAADCRDRLADCIESGWFLADGLDHDAHPEEIDDLTEDRDHAIRRLAVAGATLQSELAESISAVAPYGGVVLVAQDTEVTGSSTFPWNALFDDDLPFEGDGVDLEDDASDLWPICFNDHPKGETDHKETTICVARFWGLAYEVAWPNGWVPTTQTSERPGLGLWRRLRRGTSRPFSINVLDNREPVLIHSIDHPDSNEVGNLAAGLPAGTVLSRTVGGARLSDDVKKLQEEAEVLHFFGHGSNIDGDFILKLDEASTLNGESLIELAQGNEFKRGPLVLVSACSSGATGSGTRNGLAEAFRTLGARAIVLTESPIMGDEAMEVAAATLREVAAGAYVSSAVRTVRHESFFRQKNLSALAYTYYGPSGLRLANPVIDLRPTSETHQGRNSDDDEEEVSRATTAST